MDLFSNMIWFGLVIIVVAAVIEAITPSMVSICFSFAGIIALLAALLQWHIGIQFVLFVVALALALYFLFPILRKLAKLDTESISQKYVKTNLDLIIGEKATVLQDISYLNDGLVKIDGKERTAKTDSQNAHYHKGDVVSVKAITGSKLLVE